MDFPVELSDILKIVQFLPEREETHDLLIRLRTIMELAPLIPSGRQSIDMDLPGVVPAGMPPAGTLPPDEQPDEPWEAGNPKMVNPPFGWKRHGKRICRSKVEQEILRRILQGVKKGWSNSQVASDLNGRSLTTRRGSKWDSGGIGRLRKGAIEHAMNTRLKHRYG